MKILFTVIVSLMLGCAVAQAKLDGTPRVAVISAYAPEAEILLAGLEGQDSFVVNGRTFTTGTLAGSEVVLFLSGVSMVNAAMTTQLALDQFNVEAIVFSGIAGGVNPDLSVGDVTVPERWGQYQEQFFARKTAEGFDTGFYERTFEPYGIMFPKDVEVTAAGDEPDAVEERFWFPVDETMLSVAGEVAAQVELTDCTPDDICLESEPEVVTGGSGVSGSTFVDNADYRAWVWDTFEAQALDMETAAVAHVAYANGVPYIAFRSLSDLAGGGPGENELGTFFQLAANNSAALVTQFLAAWTQRD